MWSQKVQENLEISSIQLLIFKINSTFDRVLVFKNNFFNPLFWHIGDRISIGVPECNVWFFFIIIVKIVNSIKSSTFEKNHRLESTFFTFRIRKDYIVTDKKRIKWNLFRILPWITFILSVFHNSDARKCYQRFKS